MDENISKICKYIIDRFVISFENVETRSFILIFNLKKQISSQRAIQLLGAQICMPLQRENFRDGEISSLLK